MMTSSRATYRFLNVSSASLLAIPRHHHLYLLFSHEPESLSTFLNLSPFLGKRGVLFFINRRRHRRLAERATRDVLIKQESSPLLPHKVLTSWLSLLQCRSHAPIACECSGAKRPPGVAIVSCSLVSPPRCIIYIYLNSRWRCSIQQPSAASVDHLSQPLHVPRSENINIILSDADIKMLHIFIFAPKKRRTIRMSLYLIFILSCWSSGRRCSTLHSPNEMLLLLFYDCSKACDDNPQL